MDLVLKREIVNANGAVNTILYGFANGSKHYPIVAARHMPEEWGDNGWWDFHSDFNKEMDDYFREHFGDELQIENTKEAMMKKVEKAATWWDLMN